MGGRACGLAFSLSLASYYFGYSALRISTPQRSRYRYALLQLIAYTQWLVLPSLLIWSLNRFSVDDDDRSTWGERTFSGRRAEDASLRQWICGPDGLIETVTVGSWDKLLRYSAPGFQLCEGFCSLLVIQATGQVTRWLVNRSGRSDSWMVESVWPFRGIRANFVCLDWAACYVCIHHFQLGILPLAGDPLSRDW